MTKKTDLARVDTRGDATDSPTAGANVAVRPLRLSEAIRLGAMMKPQGFGRMFRNGRSCALGAAWDAIEGLTAGQLPLPVQLKTRWPVLLIHTAHPDDVSICCTVYGCIVDLNDEYSWTRERIADWVESIERQDESPAAREATPLVSVETVNDGEILV